VSNRVFNFNAGPANLPLPVLEEIQAELLDFQGSGMSIIESSHRSPEYSAVHEETQSLFHELLGIGDDYKVMFVGGGASTQFFTLPMNLLSGGKKADYIRTGTWAKKAIKEAELLGDIHVAGDSENEEGKFNYCPNQSQLDLRDGTVYLHFTTNNTIAGTQYHTFPEPVAGSLLVADMSSDILSRKFDANKFGVIFAGAQKNLGPAGVTVVIMRKDVLDLCADGIPSMVSYKTHAKKDSLFNTPPVFPIYAIGKVLKWVKGLGGLEAMERINREKAGLVYGAIEGNPDFYRSPIQADCRSMMNIVWRCPTEELEQTFVAEAKAAGLSGLKGHRSVGGCRASVYNAHPMEGVQTLAGFMNDFAQKNG
jgi:phosphoserine aminotransferase